MFFLGWCEVVSACPAWPEPGIWNLQRGRGGYSAELSWREESRQRSSFFKLEKYELFSIFRLFYTDKKEKKIFLIYKEIQMGSVAKSYMRRGFLIYEENLLFFRKYLDIYEEDVTHTYMTLQLLHSEFPYIWGKFLFLFYQCNYVLFQLCNNSQNMSTCKK
jgi:hypothetical protein